MNRHETARTAAVGQFYRPDVDGLRAIAVVLVLGHHYFPTKLGGGFIGVDIFFVISGWLITTIILDATRAGTFSFADFYARRVRRIFPALVVVLVATIAIAWFILLPHDYAKLGVHAFWGSIFYSNLGLLSEAGYFDASSHTKPLLHLWSLAIEEQFYLLWPMVLVALRGRPHLLFLTLAAITLSSFAYGVVLTEQRASAAFYNPLSRLWALSLGGCLAFSGQGWAVSRSAVSRSVLAAVGSGCLLTGVLLITPSSKFPGWLALLPTVGTALIIAAGPQNALNRLIANPISVFVGKISYPLYLWHWPLLVLATYQAGGLSTADRLWLLVASFLLSIATYILLERRLRAVSARSAAMALVPIMVAIGIAGLAIYASGGVGERYPPEIRKTLSYLGYDYRSTDSRYLTCWLIDEPFSAYADECKLPAPHGSSSVLLWGDSHAGRLYPGLRNALPKHIALAEFARSSCPPLLTHPAECGASNASILSEIGRSKPATVLLFASWNSYGDDWRPDSDNAQNLRSTVNAAKKEGAGQVVILGPAPWWDPILPMLLYRDWLSSGKILKSKPGAETRVSETDRNLAKMASEIGVHYVSILDLLCSNEECPTVVPGTADDLMTWDYGHLTTEGATFVASQLPLSLFLRYSSSP